MKIIPSILENSITEFNVILDKIAGFARVIHVDIDDGSFGGNKTVEIGEIASDLKKLSERTQFEAHLMVQRPLDYVVGLEQAGVHRVIFQAEKEGEIRSVLEEFAYQGFSVGLAISPDSDVELIEPYLEIIDVVTVMTVEPGRQGNEFRQDCLKKVATLRSLGFMGEIEIDGGIDEANARIVKEKGVDVVVVGHAIVKAEAPGQSYANLERLLNE